MDGLAYTKADKQDFLTKAGVDEKLVSTEVSRARKKAQFADISPAAVEKAIGYLDKAIECLRKPGKGKQLQEKSVASSELAMFVSQAKKKIQERSGWPLQVREELTSGKKAHHQLKEKYVKDVAVLAVYRQVRSSQEQYQDYLTAGALYYLGHDEDTVKINKCEKFPTRTSEEGKQATERVRARRSAAEKTMNELGV
jgi:hypothetical protein